MIPYLQSRPALWRFVKFLFVGVLNTAFGYAVYAVLILIGLAPQPSLAIASFIGVLWNFGIHKRLVFDTQGYRRLPHYILGYCFVYAINATALAVALRAGLHPLMAQALLILPMALLAFVVVSLALTGALPFGRKNPNS
jgi:putative flippase GtrA